MNKFLLTGLFFLAGLWVSSAQLPDYCTPNFPSGCGAGDDIDDFVMEDAGINHLNTGCSTGSYGDFTGDSSLQGLLIAGLDYDFSTTHNFGSQFVTIWIDLDQNGTFDAGELLFQSTAGGVTNSGTISIPADADEGLTVMRVMTSWNGANTNPCTGSGWGETHDYAVNILEAPDCLFPTGVSVSNLTGVSAEVNFNEVADATNGYQWELFEEDDDVEVDDPLLTGTIDAGDTSVVIDGLEAETTYQVVLISDCDTDGLSDPTNPVTFTTLEGCVPPSTITLSGITSDTVEISWSVIPNAENGYTWFVFNAGANPETATPVETGTVPLGTNSVTATGIPSGQSFDVYVSADCGVDDGESDLSAAVSFQTTCAIFDAPYVENFDGPTWVPGTGFANTGYEIDQCWDNDEPAAGFFWGTRTGDSNSTGTGPSDDVSGGGNYIYLRTSGGSEGAIAFLQGPPVDISDLNTPSISFYYHMFGPDMGTLSLEVRELGTDTWEEVFSLSGQQQTSSDADWIQEFVVLDNYDDVDIIEFRFLGERGPGFTGNKAVDSVIVGESPTCFDVTSLVVTTTGEDSASFEWDDNPDAEDGFIWEVFLLGEDPLNDTPLLDGVAPEGSTDLTVTGLDPDTQYILKIVSDCGAEDGVSFPGNTVQFTTQCAVFAAPYFENFDGSTWESGTGFGNINAVYDQCWEADPLSPAFFWGPREGTTGTGGTGPETDFSGSGNYMFTESSNGSTGDEAFLISPLIDLSSLATPSVQFKYHMFGPTTGSLRLEVKEESSSTWEEVFELVGEQQTSTGADWGEAIVDISDYEDDTVQFRFVGVKGTSFTSDMAVDDFLVDEAPTCFNVQGLQFVSSTESEATLEWDENLDATDGYVWDVFPEGDDPFNDVPFLDGTTPTNSVTVTGLNPSTVYQFRVRSDCGIDGVSSPGVLVTFQTACDVVSAPFSEDFDGSAWASGTGFGNTNPVYDQCWEADPLSPAFFWGTREGATGTGSTGPSSDVSGSGNYIFVESSNGSQGDIAYFISPLVDVSPLDNPALSFYYHMFGATTGTLAVEVKEASASNWDEIFSISGQQQGSQDADFEQVFLDLSAYENLTIQVRFKAVKGSSFTGDKAIDEVVIDEAPSCFNVTGFSAAPAITTALLTWNEIPSAIDGYDIEVFDEGDDTPFLTQNVAQNETSFEVTGLEEGETYVASITSNCGVDDGLGETIEITFTTVSQGDTCEAAIVVDALPYETTDDTANYSDFYDGSPGAECSTTSNYLGGNDVVYSFTPAEDMVVLVTMDPTNTWSGIFVYESCTDIGNQCLNGEAAFNSDVREFEVTLTGGEDYFFVISTFPAPQTTGYTFELTQVLCGSVGGLDTTFVGSDEIDFSWDAVPGAISYEWFLFSNGDDPDNDTPIETGTTANTEILIDGLTSATAYDFYVRSECDDDALGNLTGPFTVVTECAPQNYPTPVENFSNANFNYNTNDLMPCWSEGTGDLTASMTVNITNGTWTAANFNGQATSPNGNAARVPLSGTGTSWLVSQQIDLGDGTDDLVIEYDVAVNELFGFSPDPIPTIGQNTVSVVVSTDGGNTWSDTDVVKLYDDNNFPGSPTTEFVSLDGYTGIVKIGFYANRIASQSASFFIDNFRVIESPTCFAPINLEAEIVGLEDVEFTWDTNPLNAIEDQWEVQYGLEGFELDSDEAESVIVNDDPEVIVSGLASASDYEFYVRAICGPDDFSEWSNPAEFRSPIVPIEIGAGEFHNEVYCYGNFETTEWLFVSTADEELDLIFNAGSVEDATGSNDVLRIYDGFNDNGILIHDTSVDGAILAGFTFTSTSGGFYLILTTDIVQSCQGGQGELPEEFDFDVLSETFSTPGFGKEEFSYYPNPVKTMLNIQSANPVEAYELYNINGQRLMNGRPNTNSPSINMDGLQTGVYLMKVTINGNSETFQVIKQ